ncbi:MAG: histidine kinase N-terminal 7TM domain-containing protein [Oscillospiraceae bacterium]|nr:histidine kinase N-terminal 7TM domain-containing protein [Oscillospiraceae bacterium]
MNYLLSGLLIALIVIAAVLLLYSIKTKSAQIALLYVLFFCVVDYSIGYSLELLANTEQQMMLCNLIQFIGIPLIPALWLIYILNDIHYNTKCFFSPVYSYSILFIPFLCFIARLTNSIHHLYYVAFHIEPRPFPVLILEKGPFYYLLTVYSFLCIACSALLLLKSIKKGTELAVSRSKLLMLIMITPSAALLLKLFGYSPWGIDLLPFSFLISLFFFCQGFRKYYLLDEKYLLIDELQSNGNILLMVLEAIDNVIILFDNASDRVWLMNDVYTSCFGEPLDRNIKPALDQILDRIHPEDKKMVQQEFSLIKHVSRENGGRFEYRMRNKSNEYIWVRSDIRLVSNSSRKGKLVLFNINNINEERKTLEALTKRAEMDVTGIYNRVTAFEKINEYLSSNLKNKTYALLLFDIDNLKKINDSCGHYTGDLVIDGFVQVLRSKIQSKSILGRLGGDEFIAFLLNVPSKKDLELLLKDIMRDSNELQQKFALPLPVSISVGIAQTSSRVLTLQKLYENADIALYKVKGDCKNDFCFHDSLPPTK